MKRTSTDHALTVLGQIMAILKLAKEIERIQKRVGQSEPNGLKVLLGIAERRAVFAAGSLYREYFTAGEANFAGRAGVPTLIISTTEVVKDEVDAYCKFAGYEYGSSEDAAALIGTPHAKILVLDQVVKNEAGVGWYRMYNRSTHMFEEVRIDGGIPNSYAILVKRAA